MASRQKDIDIDTRYLEQAVVDAELDVLECLPDPAALGGLVKIGLGDHLGEPLVDALPPRDGRHRRDGCGDSPPDSSSSLLLLFRRRRLLLFLLVLVEGDPDPNKSYKRSGKEYSKGPGKKRKKGIKNRVRRSTVHGRRTKKVGEGRRL